MESYKQQEVHGLFKVPDSVLLADSQKLVGELKSEIDYLNSEIKKLKIILNSNLEFNSKLTSDEKIRVKSDKKVEELTIRNEKLKEELKLRCRTISDLIYEKLKNNSKSQ